MRSWKISSSASSKTLKTSKLCSTIQRPGAVSGSALVKIWALSRCSTHGWYTIDAPQGPQAMVYNDARDHAAPHTGKLLCSTMLHDGTPWWSTSTHRYTMIVFYNAPQCFTQLWCTMMHWCCTHLIAQTVFFISTPWCSCSTSPAYGALVLETLSNTSKCPCPLDNVQELSASIYCMYVQTNTTTATLLIVSFDEDMILQRIFDNVWYTIYM